VVGGRPGGSTGKSACGGGHGQRVRISDVELGVGGEHSVYQQVTQLGLGPTVHNAVNDAVQVSARVDVVRARRTFAKPLETKKRAYPRRSARRPPTLTSDLPAIMLRGSAKCLVDLVKFLEYRRN
jgi:hypothetical protein